MIKLRKCYKFDPQPLAVSLERKKKYFTTSRGAYTTGSDRGLRRRVFCSSTPFLEWPLAAVPFWASGREEAWQLVGIPEYLLHIILFLSYRNPSLYIPHLLGCQTFNHGSSINFFSYQVLNPGIHMTPEPKHVIMPLLTFWTKCNTCTWDSSAE